MAEKSPSYHNLSYPFPSRVPFYIVNDIYQINLRQLMRKIHYEIRLRFIFNPKTQATAYMSPKLCHNCTSDNWEILAPKLNYRRTPYYGSLIDGNSCVLTNAEWLEQQYIRNLTGDPRRNRVTQKGHNGIISVHLPPNYYWSSRSFLQQLRLEKKKTIVRPLQPHILTKIRNKLLEKITI